MQKEYHDKTGKTSIILGIIKKKGDVFMKNIKRKTKPDWNKPTAEDLQKLEIAEEIGVIDKIYSGGYGNLTSKESGKIGGILAARNKAKKK